MPITAGSDQYLVLDDGIWRERGVVDCTWDRTIADIISGEFEFGGRLDIRVFHANQEGPVFCDVTEDAARAVMEKIAAMREPARYPVQSWLDEHLGCRVGNIVREREIA